VGLNTNVQFLDDLAGHPEFGLGHVHTGFIDEHRQALFPGPRSLSDETLCQAVAALLLSEATQSTSSSTMSNGTIYINSLLCPASF